MLPLWWPHEPIFVFIKYIYWCWIFGAHAIVKDCNGDWDVICQCCLLKVKWGHGETSVMYATTRHNKTWDEHDHAQGQAGRDVPKLVDEEVVNMQGQSEQGRSIHSSRFISPHKIDTGQSRRQARQALIKAYAIEVT
jgi:hypothetical protein